MVMSKRAQIFLLAAVIISAVVISLGITANQAKISSEPKNFYDFSYNVEREIGAIMDYEIYTNFSEDDNLEEFIDLLAEDIKDKNPNANFMFIYKDEDDVILKAYNPQKSDKKSTISIGGIHKEVPNENTEHKETLDEDDLEDVDEIVVEMNGNEFSLPIDRFRNSLFVIQIGRGNENFITAG
ncbi:hypothetical protein KAJ38_00385 [Candidatus Pacearchaeota archaeon]|nr:hypothetical protein [Candidatus Pacearchaeota archaeon]